jgi:REP element-mobilizing transposase RayT
MTEYRRPVFTAALLERMKQIRRNACDAIGCELAEFNGEPDYVRQRHARLGPSPVHRQ